MLVKVSLACLAISLIVTSNMYSEAAGTVPTTATPTAPTQKPTTAPTQKPTAATTQKPTTAPTTAPTQKPTTAPTTKSTQKPTTAPTTKPTTGTPAVTPSTSNPVPLGFSYSCNSNGDLTVNKTELKSYDLKVLSPPTSLCKSVSNTKTYEITGCGKNIDIVVLLEAKHHNRMIVGGKSREFKLYCHDSTAPYLVNVTLSAVTVTEPSSYTSLPTVSPSKSTVSLTMSIYDKGTGKEVTSAVIGQEMTLKIENTGLDTIDPVECYATHGNESYMFWSDSICETDETLVGHQWQKESAKNSVSIVLYAFHFEKSHDVGIMCSVRVCPQGYSGKDCDLTCNKGPNGKRRRRAAMAKDIHTINVRTNIHVIDTDPVTASATGLAVNTFFVLTSSIFVKLHQW